MIRALFTWSLKISAALYVRHFHFLHTIEEAEVLNQNEFDSFDNYNLNLLLILKSATIIQYTIKGRFMSR